MTLLLSLFLALPAHAVTVELEPGADVAALTSSMGPGDEFIFHAGTYELPGALTWTAVGTEGDPVVIRSAGDGDAILQLADGGHVVRLNDSAFVVLQDLVLTGTDAHYDESGFAGLVIANSTDLEVSDLLIEHVGGTGLALSGDNQRIDVHDVHVRDSRTGPGIQIGCGNASCWTSDSTFTNNLVHGMVGDRRYGIELLPGGQGNTFVDNVVFGVTGVGIGVSTTEFGAPNVVEGNVVWNATDAGIRVAGSATVRNNVVFQVDGNGIRSSDQFPDSLQDVVISHNTVVDTSDFGIRLQGWDAKTGMVLANNAVANPTGRAFTVDNEEWDETNVIVGNVMTGLVEKLDATMGHFTAGSGYADFEDAASWDFYPTPASSLLGAGDAGSDAYVPDSDFSGFARNGQSADVGAYTFVGDGNPGWVIREDFKGPAGTPNTGEDVGGGCGMKDVTYFLSSCLDPNELDRIWTTTLVPFGRI